MQRRTEQHPPKTHNPGPRQPRAYRFTDWAAI